MASRLKKFLKFVKKMRRTFDEVSANQLFSDYMHEIENVIEAVDNLDKS